ncbi:MAG: GTPase HflX [Candidatus Hydrogenedentes bacterium]|nr:GTPase HflX [Candidatus Hydrogenedentota bacterium]
MRLVGNTHGLRAAPLKRLQKLTTRKSPAERIIGPELARALTELAAEIQRQVGVLLDRRGHVEYVLVGDARSVYLPDLSAYRRGRDRLAGLRLVHTHFNNEPLNDDDLTDLALLRLDLVAAIGVLEDGLPGTIFFGQLLPANEDEQPWRLTTVRSVHELQDDFLESIDALEDEFSRLRKPRRAGDQRDRAILVHVSQDTPSHAEDSMAELRELARSAGIDVVHEVIQRRPVDPRFVMGKGRLQATVIKAMQLGAELLVFDQDLTPAHVNALADYTDLKVLDRTQVILDIFGQRAVTREGKIQVELAQLRYLLPRLGAKQTASAFSRLTGGIGGRGPGETKLEIDRRRAQDRISALEREVEKLGERRRLRRSERNRREVPIVSIVGYTNAGKSTLLNNLTQSEVIAENVLFATLNPVSRRLRFPREREIIITDTVGFIRNLPKDLMSAFRTTLEELDDADLLVHVLDASSQHLDDEKATVDSVLAQLHLDTKPLLLVLNKADLCNPDELNGLTNRLNGIPLCALDRSTFRPLLEAIETQLWAAAQNTPTSSGEWPHEVPTQAD